MNTFYGFKIGQSQDYDSAGKRWPITMVKVEPMTVTKNSQVVFGHKNKRISSYLKSYKTEKAIGEKIFFFDLFNTGDKIKVTGTSKGKGFQGVVRRHHFAGGPKTHGQSDRERHPGSIGSTTTPGRVLRGKRMAGHLGNTQATVKNLSVFSVSPEENLLVIKGLVPGAVGSLVRISK